MHKRSQLSLVHCSHDSVVSLMETGTRMVVIPTSLQLPSGSPSYGHYQNSSGICHFRNQNDTGGETSLVGTDYSPVPGQSGPQEPICRACCPQHAVHYATSAAGRDLIYASCCTGICHFDLIEKHIS